MRRNASDQRTWLVLRPIAELLGFHSDHAVEEEDSELVRGVILDVVRGGTMRITPRAHHDAAMHGPPRRRGCGT